MRNKETFKLKDLKKAYLETQTPNNLKLGGWDELSRKISPGPNKKPKYMYFKSFAFIAVFLLVITGSLFFFIKGVAASMPGDFLYNVKVLSQKITGRQFATNNSTSPTPTSEPIYEVTQTPDPESTPSVKKNPGSSLPPMPTIIPLPLPTPPISLPELQQVIEALPSIIPINTKKWFNINLFR